MVSALVPMMMMMIMMMMAVSLGGGKWAAAAEVHHVVGGDRGWDLPSNVDAWSSGRVFRVGDKLCELLFGLAFKHSSSIISFFLFFIKKKK